MPLPFNLPDLGLAPPQGTLGAALLSWLAQNNPFANLFNGQFEEQMNQNIGAGRNGPPLGAPGGMPVPDSGQFAPMGPAGVPSGSIVPGQSQIPSGSVGAGAPASSPYPIPSTGAPYNPAQASGGRPGLPAPLLPPRPPVTPQQAAAAASGARVAGPPVGANGQPAAPGTINSPAGAAMIRYPTSNPSFAMRSALLDQGINPYIMNPAMGMLLRSAGGLGNTFLAQNIGASSNDIKAAGGEGAMFANYLRQALTESGSVDAALSAGLGGLGDTMRKLTALRAGMTSELDLAASNPFASRLSEIWGDGRGVGEAYSSLVTPFLSGSTAQSYERGLAPIIENALRATGHDLGSNVGKARNFWEYLFPNL